MFALLLYLQPGKGAILNNDFDEFFMRYTTLDQMFGLMVVETFLSFGKLYIVYII